MHRSPWLPRTAAAALAIFASAAVLSYAASHPASPSHLLPPSALRCEGQTAPLAVDSAQPRFSWQLAPASPQLHGVAQSAYEVQVAAAEGSFVSPLWESGEVESAATARIAYAGPPLEAGHAYTWRVRAWDELRHPTAWSATARWTQAPVWRARWIAAPENDSPVMPLFRRAFVVNQPIVRAMLYASGLGQDELRLNGRKVGNDQLTPGWSEYRKTVYYDSYDVTSMLHAGRNALGVMLGNGMYRVLKTPGRYTKFVGSYGVPKCVVQLHIEFAGGRTLDIESDAAWKTHPGPMVFSSTYGGEDYDARRELPGWDRPGFDDSGWKAVQVVDGSGGALRPEVAPPIRVIRTYTPVTVTHPKLGVTVYDLGQNFAGWPVLAVTGPAGAQVKLVSGELLHPDGTVSQRSAGGGPQWFAYTLRGKGVERWHPRFSYWGFRYVQVEPSRAKLISLTGQAVHSTSPQVGSFRSSDRLLNRIHALIAHAIENNAESLFTDCPHREKLGWLEEAHLLAPSQLYDFDFAGLYAATARNIADTQTLTGPAAGRIPEIAPQYVLFDPHWGIFDDSPEWSSTAVLAPWYVYQRTGDPHLLAANYPVMQRYVAYLATRTRDGIIAYGLGDWYDIGPGPPGVSKLTTLGLTATAIDYQDLRVMEKTAALLGKTADSLAYRKQAEAVRAAFNQRFFDPVHHRYDKGSQTAQAMPLSIGLVPAGERAAVLRALVGDIRAHRNHVTAGDIGFHYVVDALLANGRSDVLYDMLERTDSPSYGYQLARGATALTEAWDANPSSSQDHSMLGHGEEWFYRGLGGIDIDCTRQGPRRLILRPAVVGGLAWVRTSYQSAFGPIKSNWRRGAKATDYDFTVPVSTTAALELVTASPSTLTVNGAAPSRAAGVVSVHASGDTLQIVVQSGRYRIRAANSVSAAHRPKGAPLP